MNFSPTFLYGTAWKEEQTTQLTLQAIEAGFRGIDTANQRRHYFEEAVGDALKSTWEGGTLSREDFFIQTKWTHRRGQDHRLPYDEHASFTTQVRQSFASSQQHLGTDFIDAYILHGPMGREGLSDSDWEVWRAMEGLHSEKLVGALGASNMNPTQLKELVDGSQTAISYVQNRCYARMGWDAEIRAICEANHITYQGFSLLTANRFELKQPTVTEMASRYDLTTPQLVFAFSKSLGMLPLTGTSNPLHMKQDLAALQVQLDAEDVRTLEAIGVKH